MLTRDELRQARQIMEMEISCPKELLEKLCDAALRGIEAKELARQMEIALRNRDQTPYEAKLLRAVKLFLAPSLTERKEQEDECPVCGNQIIDPPSNTAEQQQGDEVDRMFEELPAEAAIRALKVIQSPPSEAAPMGEPNAATEDDRRRYNPGAAGNDESSPQADADEKPDELRGDPIAGSGNGEVQAYASPPLSSPQADAGEDKELLRCDCKPLKWNPQCPQHGTEPPPSEAELFSKWLTSFAEAGVYLPQTAKKLREAASLIERQAAEIGELKK